MNPSDPKLTHRGRLGGNQDTAPVRRRANSVRRLAVPVLEHIRDNPKAHPADRHIAGREVTLRQEMQTLSARQTVPDHGQERAHIMGRQGASPAAIDALRYSQSMAEEVVYVRNQALSTTKQKKEIPGMIGVAERGGRIGVGLSGTQTDYQQYGGPIAKDMLRAQESYSAAERRNWSGRLVPNDGPSITASGNICAATRATSASGHRPGSTDRSAFGTPTSRDSLVEANRQSFGGHPSGAGADHRETAALIDELQGQNRIGREAPNEHNVRLRRDSLRHVAESCSTCKDEYHRPGGGRSRSGSDSSSGGK